MSWWTIERLGFVSKIEKHKICNDKEINGMVFINVQNLLYVSCKDLWNPLTVLLWLSVSKYLCTSYSIWVVYSFKTNPSIPFIYYKFPNNVIVKTMTWRGLYTLEFNLGLYIYINMDIHIYKHLYKIHIYTHLYKIDTYRSLTVLVFVRVKVNK